MGIHSARPVHTLFIVNSTNNRRGDQQWPEYACLVNAIDIQDMHYGDSYRAWMYIDRNSLAHSMYIYV